MQTPAQGHSNDITMNTSGLPALWHSATAIVAQQTPFMAILLVTLAALFVVMALEGFRSSLMAIWRAHRTSAPTKPTSLETPVRLAAPAPHAPRTRSFTAKKPPRSPRPKVLDQPPRQFRSPRPTIHRSTAFMQTEDAEAVAPIPLPFTGEVDKIA
jgi:hypothetical protein